MIEIKTIFEFFGGRIALAKKLNCTPQALTYWKNGVPAQAAIEVERLSDGKFKAVDIPTIKKNKAA